MRFDACAHAYDAYAAPQRAFAARVAAFIAARDSEDVLEFGAGTGALTIHICRAVRQPPRATDGSPRMVTLGRQAVPAAVWGELDAFRGAVPEATLQISSGLLQWADDPLSVLRQWRDGLTPAGRMVHAFPCEPCLKEWRALAPEGPVHWRDAEEWHRIFVAAGLQVKRSEGWVEEMRFASALDMIRAMHRSGTTGRARMGPGRLRQAMRDYALKHSVPDGVVSTWAWLAFEAVLG